MERQIQKIGKRPWGGAELIKLQDELYKVIEAIFVPYNKNFVISGCELSGSGPFTLAPGVVFIDGNICEFEGAVVASVSGPVYLNKQVLETTNKAYADGVNRPTEKHYKAIIGDDSVPYIEDPYMSNNISNVIAPISNSLGSNNSEVYASSKAAYLLNQAINNTKPGNVQSGSSSIVELQYRIADNIVQCKMTFPDQSPTTGATLFIFPSTYRPNDDILVSISSGGVLKIATDGTCSLYSGILPAESNLYYYFEFPIF